MRTLDNKLRKLGAMAFVAALDFRSGKNPDRLETLLFFIADWIEEAIDLQDALMPDLQKLGKQMGFEVMPLSPSPNAPGSEEKH